MLFRDLNSEVAGLQSGGKQFASRIRMPFGPTITLPSPCTGGDSAMYPSEKKNAELPFGRTTEYVLSAPVHAGRFAGCSPLPGPF